MQGTPKVTWLIVGLVIVSMLSGIFGIYISKASDAFGITHPNDTLELYNKMDNLQSDIQTVKEDISTIKEKTGVLDVIGSFFSNAYQVLMTIPSTIDLTFSMINQGVSDANLGEGGEILKNAVIIILTVLLFIGVILTIVLKVTGVI